MGDANPFPPVLGRFPGPAAHRFLEAPLRRPRLIGLSAFALLAAGVVCTLVLPARYRAAAKFRASWEDDTAPRRADADAARRGLQDVRTRVRRRLLESTLSRAPSSSPAGGRTAPTADDATTILEAVKVEPVRPGVFSIECTHRDSVSAAHVANSLVADLVAQAGHERKRREEVRIASQARLVEARVSMEEAEAALRSFRHVASARTGGPPPASRLEALTAQNDTARARYRKLLDAWRRLEIASRTEGPLARFEIVESAKVPQAPYFPDRRLFALGGLVLGVALGLGLALLAEFRDHSIKGPADLREALPQPLLCEIPFVNVRHSRRRR